MSRGLGQAQLRILSILEKAGGVLTPGGILMSLFGKVPGPEEREYALMRSSLSRSLRALRARKLVEIYIISTGGHAATVAAITKGGVEVARKWEEAEG